MILPELDPDELANHVEKYVFGQTQAVRGIAEALAWNRARLKLIMAGRAEARHLPPKNNVLMQGRTGLGKTYLVSIAAEAAGVPFHKVEADRITAPGYVGLNLEDVLDELLKKANSDPALAGCGIIFLDEIDKITKRDMGHFDVGGVATQRVLLGVLSDEGSMVTVGKSDAKVTIDSSGITFVAAGAFEGLKAESGTGRLDPEPLISFGMIREFVGRFSVLLQLQNFDEQRLAQLLRESSSSPLIRLKTLLRLDEIELDVKDDAIAALAKLAIKTGTGVRGLNRATERVLLPLQSRVSKMVRDGVVQVTLEAATFLDAKPPLLKKGRRRIVSARKVEPTKPAPPVPPRPTPQPPAPPEKTESSAAEPPGTKNGEMEKPQTKPPAKTLTSPEPRRALPLSGAPGMRRRSWRPKQSHWLVGLVFGVLLLLTAGLVLYRQQEAATPATGPERPTEDKPPGSHRLFPELDH